MILNFISSLTIAISTWAAPHMLSETVGSAKDQVLTSRGMALSYAVESALNKKNRTLPVTREEKIQAVNGYLLDVMVGFEATTLGFADVDKEELNSLVTQAEKVLNEPEFRSEKYQKNEIHDMAEQKIIVRNFLKNRSSSFESILTEQDLQNYYDKNRLRFGSVPLKDVRENIRAFLQQQQRDERLKSWIEVLKKKYKARNYLIERQSRDAAHPH